MMEPATRSTVTAPSAVVMSNPSAAAAHAPLATANSMTQVRRRSLRSTTGAHRKYQIAGACTSAPMDAMR
jgi:hypothetical protein